MTDDKPQVKCYTYSITGLDKLATGDLTLERKATVFNYTHEDYQRLVGGANDVMNLSRYTKFIFFIPVENNVNIEMHCFNFIEINDSQHPRDLLKTRFLRNRDPTRDKIDIEIELEQMIASIICNKLIENKFVPMNAKYMCFSDAHADFRILSLGVLLSRSIPNIRVYNLGDSINRKRDYWDRRWVDKGPSGHEFVKRDKLVNAYNEDHISNNYTVLHGNHDSEKLSKLPTRVVIINPYYQLVFQHAMMISDFEMTLDYKNVKQTVNDGDYIFEIRSKEIYFLTYDLERIYDGLNELVNDEKETMARRRYAHRLIDVLKYIYNAAPDFDFDEEEFKENVTDVIPAVIVDGEIFKALDNYVKNKESQPDPGMLVNELVKELFRPFGKDVYEDICQRFRNGRYNDLTAPYFVSCSSRKHNRELPTSFEEFDSNINKSISKCEAMIGRIIVNDNPFIVVGHDLDYTFATLIAHRGTMEDMKRYTKYFRRMPYDKNAVKLTLDYYSEHENEVNDDYIKTRVSNSNGIIPRIYSTDGFHGGKSNVRITPIVLFIIIVVLIICVIALVNKERNAKRTRAFLLANYHSES